MGNLDYSFGNVDENPEEEKEVMSTEREMEEIKENVVVDDITE
jgi:hypothetical protein